MSRLDRRSVREATGQIYYPREFWDLDHDPGPGWLTFVVRWAARRWRIWALSAALWAVIAMCAAIFAGWIVL